MLKLLVAYLLLNVMLFSHARAQSITTTVCIEPKFGGLNAVFGYESSNPNVTGIVAGPNNSLSPVPADPQDRLLTVFYPGYWQQAFAIFFVPTADNPTLSWTLLGQTVSASWNTRLCDVRRQIFPQLELTDGVSFVTPGSSVTYTLTIQNPGVGAEQDGVAAVTNRFPVQCSSVNWTCSGGVGSTCAAAGTGDIDDLITLAPLGRVTYVATCATAATASGSMINVASVGGSEITDTNSIVSAIFSTNSVSAVEGNSGTAQMTFTVTRTGGTGTQTVSVASTPSSSGVSATAGVDYTPLTGTVLSFPPGVSTRTVSVAILGDAVDEPDETLNLVLSSPSSGTGINNTIGIGSIIDDDPTATRLAFSAAPARARINQAAIYAIVLDVDRPGAGIPAGTIRVNSSSGSCAITVPTNSPTTAPSCALQFAALGAQTLGASFAPSDANFSASATTVSANTLVFAQADLAVSNDDGVSHYQAGELLIYTVTLRNNGPDAAPRVRIVDELPNELQTPRWTCAGTGGAICGQANGVNNIDAVVLTMPANATLIYTLSATVATPAPATISNRAEVFLPGDGTIEDGVLSNQSQTDVNTRQAIFASGFEGP